MKKIKIEKKLTLGKEAIAKLNADQLDVVKGGGTNTCAPNTAPCTSGYGNTNCGCQASAYITCLTLDC